MGELIAINKTTINGEEVNAVNARELWIKLESKRKFSDWIKDRLKEFTEGEDFTLHKIVNGKNSGRFAPIDYIISLDAAKHIAMLERNEQGRKIRQYFIEVEKKARAVAKASADQMNCMITFAMENERLRLQLNLAKNFMPTGQPGDLNEHGVPKTQFRRGYYTSRNGKSISLLIENIEQPVLFEEKNLTSYEG